MSAVQQDLFGHARSTDPRTSRQGPHDISAACRRVLDVIAYHYGPERTFTDGDLAAKVGEERGIVARRRKDLTDGVRNSKGEVVHPGGFVEPVGRWTEGEFVQEERVGRRGRSEAVWRMTHAGFEAAGRKAVA